MAERLQKLLAAAGVDSRRRAEELIKSGAVAVNGRVCKPGDKAEPQDEITVEGKRIDCDTGGSPGRVIVYNKPVGKIVSAKDPQNRPAVFEDLPPLQKSRWVSVGRLDLNTSGLLLFCSDGVLAHKLAHPSSGIEREYMARVRGDTGRKTVEKLLSGVSLGGKKGRFEKVVPVSPTEKNNKWFKVVVKEGRNRFVRRMWESCGCSVSRLIRIRFGTVRLPKNLPSGASFFLSEKQNRKLLEIAD